MRAGRTPKVAAVLTATVAFLAVLWVLLLEPKAELRWKFKTGDVFRYQTIQVMGTPDKEVCFVSVARFAVGDVSPDGSAELLSRVERVSVRDGGPDGSVTWDSESGKPPLKDPASALAAAGIGVDLRLKVDPRGVLVSSSGHEVIQAKALDIMGGDFLGAFTEFPFSGVGQPFVGVPLPPDPVRPGQPWVSSSGAGTEILGHVSFQSEYVVEAVGDDVANIVLRRTDLTRTPGILEKALGTESKADPHDDKGWEDRARFAIHEGRLLYHRNRTWTQGTLSNGKLFRFEARMETVLLRP